MLGLGLKLGKKFASIVQDALAGIDNYFRPDGVSTYRRPDGVSTYKRPGSP
jgi:hypothetical protein